MDLNFSKEDLEFRDEVREFLDKEYPKHIKEKMNNGDEPLQYQIIDPPKLYRVIDRKEHELNGTMRRISQIKDIKGVIKETNLGSIKTFINLGFKKIENKIINQTVFRVYLYESREY